MALVGPDGNPLRPQLNLNDVLQFQINQDTGAIRLFHIPTGSYLAFNSDGTVELSDSYGSKAKTLPTGDIVISGARNVVNNGHEVFFRKPDGSTIFKIFDNSPPNANTADAEAASVSYQVGQFIGP